MKTLYILLLIVYCSISLPSRHLFKQYPQLNEYLYSDIKYYAGKYGLSEDLICAVIQKESNWNPYAIGAAGEIGLMQPLQIHYRGDFRDLFKPSTNLNVGCYRLRLSQNKAMGDVARTLIYYNKGLNTKSRVNHKYVKDIQILLVRN
jgi:soluble lytic murein transglycosylase-like protein